MIRIRILTLQTLISLADFDSHIRSPSFALSIQTLSTHLLSTLLFILISVWLMAALFQFFSQARKVEIFVRIFSNVALLCLGRLGAFGTSNRMAHLAPVTEFFRDGGTELFKAHKAETVPVKPGRMGPLP